jgi:hypothetical protein
LWLHSGNIFQFAMLNERLTRGGFWFRSDATLLGILAVLGRRNGIRIAMVLNKSNTKCHYNETGWQKEILQVKLRCTHLQIETSHGVCCRINGDSLKKRNTGTAKSSSSALEASSESQIDEKEKTKPKKRTNAQTRARQQANDNRRTSTATGAADILRGYQE